MGAVTIAHFARILDYLGILVSAEDFSLLVKKYGKNSYTINYIAFIAAIDEAVNYMEQHGMLDLGGVSSFLNFLSEACRRVPKDRIYLT